MFAVLVEGIFLKEAIADTAKVQVQFYLANI